ncbi:hypothetical protein ACPPVT_06810 [Angustibacter sp. McL0619]|uniref:hypothetical protein n=1 Tax=Angustibacter sp. McL0619 TaxID=3415676 RepID=UPI003CF5DACA
MSDLLLPDEDTAADLATYLARARRVDPDGAARLVAAGATLAVYVSPVHGGGGPTVIGLRVLALAEPATADRTVPMAALSDRLARPVAASGPVRLALPPMDAADAGWAGVGPPRSGWQAVGTVDAAALGDAARAGIEEIAAGAGQGAGSAVVSRLRALVWGRDMVSVPGLAAGAAFAVESLGFLGSDDPVTLHAAGPWQRLSSVRGHVLVRRSML